MDRYASNTLGPITFSESRSMMDQIVEAARKRKGKEMLTQEEINNLHGIFVKYLNTFNAQFLPPSPANTMKHRCDES